MHFKFQFLKQNVFLDILQEVFSAHTFYLLERLLISVYVILVGRVLRYSEFQFFSTNVLFRCFTKIASSTYNLLLQKLRQIGQKDLSYIRLR